MSDNNSKNMMDEATYPKHQRPTKADQEHLRELRDSLKGKSLKIYYYLTKNPEYHGVREIQRIFDYSSPNLAQYHLKRLYEAELLDKNDQNQYRVIENPVKLGKLHDQVQIANIWIPHSMVYAISLFMLAVATLVYYLLDLSTFIYPITLIPVLLVLGIQFVRDALKILELYNKGSDEES